MEVLRLLTAPGVGDDFRAALREAIDVVRQALRVFPRAGELAFSFNGGKDSTAVLHIIRAALVEHGDAAAVAAGAPPPAGAGAAAADAAPPQQPTMLPVVYFDSSSDNFPEVLRFMSDAATQHGFSVRTLPGFKAGLQELVSSGVRGVLMGTRSTDPDGAALSSFSPTSLNWPPCMRICPALHWSYSHVWTLLRGASLPYCSLYDAGYTSLGSTTDSVPNPLLLLPPPPCAGEGGVDGGMAHPGGEAGKRFLPAWQLSDGSAERLGRSRNSARRAPPPPAAVAAGAPIAPAQAQQPQQPTAAVLVIGDELLSGRVADTNGPFLCRQLTRACGFAVQDLVVVRDDVAAIAVAVTQLRLRHTCVFTAGGLGPTHDDVTMRGVAAAFGYPVARCPDLARLLEAIGRRQQQRLPTEASAAATADAHRLRMADLPCGPAVRLHYGNGTAGAFCREAAASPAVAGGPPPCDDAALLARGYPLVSVANVWVLPGVPSILARKWGAHAAQFAALGGVPHTVEAVELAGVEESAIAGVLERVAAHYAGRVRVGSYPVDDGAAGGGAGQLQAAGASSPPPAGGGGAAPATALVVVELSGARADAVAEARAALVTALQDAMPAVSPRAMAVDPSGLRVLGC